MQMARLAEQVPAETADSVKRRFLRQNRELARVNSSYSTRISNLEAKVTSLVSENLELRHKVVTLERSREEWLSQKCSDVRAKIASRMKDIENILDTFEKTARADITTIPQEALDQFEPDLSHVSIRKRSSPMAISPDDSDADVPIDVVSPEVNSPRSPQIKEHRFAPEELSAEEIPESPSAFLDQLPQIKSGLETIRPMRRKRRDSLQEIDIISMVKGQNESYKAKLSNNTAAPMPLPAPPGVDDAEFLTAGEAEPKVVKPMGRRRSSVLPSEMPQYVRQSPKGSDDRDPPDEDVSEPAAIQDDRDETHITTSAPEVTRKADKQNPVKPQRKALQQKNMNLSREETRPIGKKADVVKTKEIKPAVVDEQPPTEESAIPEGNRRATGRARKSINYALPSLRAKMRREHDDLAPAVIVLSDYPDQRARSEPRQVEDEIEIKAEPVDDDFVSQPAEAVIGSRKRRSSSLYVAPDVIKTEKGTELRARKSSTSAKPEVTVPRQPVGDIYDLPDVVAEPAIGSRRRSGITGQKAVAQKEAVEPIRGRVMAELEVARTVSKRRRSMMV